MVSNCQTLLVLFMPTFWKTVPYHQQVSSASHHEAWITRALYKTVGFKGCCVLVILAVVEQFSGSVPCLADVRSLTCQAPPAQVSLDVDRGITMYINVLSLSLCIYIYTHSCKIHMYIYIIYIYIDTQYAHMIIHVYTCTCASSRFKQ